MASGEFFFFFALERLQQELMTVRREKNPTGRSLPVGGFASLPSPRRGSPRVVRSSATSPGARDRSARAALSRRRGTGAARGFRGGGSPGARAGKLGRVAIDGRVRRGCALCDVTRRTTMRPPERRCCEASAGTGGAAPRVEHAAAPPRVDASRRSNARATRAGESARDAEWAPRRREAPYARTVCCSTAAGNNLSHQPRPSLAGTQ